MPPQNCSCSLKVATGLVPLQCTFAAVLFIRHSDQLHLFLVSMCMRFHLNHMIFKFDCDRKNFNDKRFCFVCSHWRGCWASQSSCHDGKDIGTGIGWKHLCFWFFQFWMMKKLVNTTAGSPNKMPWNEERVQSRFLWTKTLRFKTKTLASHVDLSD